MFRDLVVYVALCQAVVSLSWFSCMTASVVTLLAFSFNFSMCHVEVRSRHLICCVFRYAVAHVAMCPLTVVSLLWVLFMK